MGNNFNSDFSCRTEQVREAGQVCDQVQGLNFLQLRLLCPHKVCCKCFRGNSIISEEHDLYFTHFIETFKILYIISLSYFLSLSAFTFLLVHSTLSTLLYKYFNSRACSFSHSFLCGILCSDLTRPQVPSNSYKLTPNFRKFLLWSPPTPLKMYLRPGSEN